jgi:hypothetical protein
MTNDLLRMYRQVTVDNCGKSLAGALDFSLLDGLSCVENTKKNDLFILFKKLVHSIQFHSVHYKAQIS